MRTTAFGEQRVTLLDRLGNWLSLRAIQPHFAGVERPYIIDLGAGYRARLLRVLATPGMTCHAIDVKLDPKLADLPGFKLTEGLIPSALTTIGDSSADLVMLISVLEHLTEPDRVLSECHRVLKPGGCLLVNVPTWRGKRFLEFAAFRLGWCPSDEIDDHKTYYDMPALWSQLVASGLLPSRIRVRRI